MEVTNENLYSSEEMIIEVQNILQQHDDELLSSFLSNLTDIDVAFILASFPLNSRLLIWNSTPNEHKGNVLAKLTEDVRASLMSDMNEAEVCVLTQDLGAQEVADILDTTTDEVKDVVIDALDEFTREKVELLRTYGDDQVGRYMNPVTVSVKESVTLETVQRYIRINNLLNELQPEIMVTDANNRFVGTLSLVDLISQSQEGYVCEFMLEPISILDEQSIHDAAIIFRSKNLHFAPVVNEQGILVGQLTTDDILEITREDSDNTMMSMSGVGDDKELFAPIMHSTKSRGVWLGINLATAFLASFVIGQFEAVLSQLVALAVLMPIVASMGGIAGSQALSVIMRGMVMGKIAGNNRWWLFNKELWVGALNGLVWAFVVGIIAQFWFGDYMVSLVIFLAIAINMTVANVSGVAIPLLLKKINIDPALSGAVILTTITDVVGFVSFLGLATLLILV